MFTQILGSTSRQRLLRGAGLIVVVIGAVVATKTMQQGPKTRPPAATPVSVEKVARQDVPVYRYGFGTVRPFNNVVLKTRVDGTLDKVMFREGQEVNEGDVLAQIDPRPYKAALDLALAKKAQDDAQLVKAKGDLTRSQALRASQFASQQTLEAQQATVDQAAALVNGDQAQVENARVQLSYTTIRAPVSGRIGLRQVDAGNIVHASDQTGLATISQVHPISVIFSLGASELNAITKAGVDAPLPVVAFTSDDKEKLSDGKLLTADNAVDEATGTIKMKATFANPDNRLWPGQSVSTHILLDTLHGVLTLPARAAQRGPNGLFVYTVQSDSTVAIRPIETSETFNDRLVLVSTTLAEGDVVVTDGQSRLEPGAHIVIRGGAKDEGAAAKTGAPS